MKTMQRQKAFFKTKWYYQGFKKKVWATISAATSKFLDNLQRKLWPQKPHSSVISRNIKDYDKITTRMKSQLPLQF